LTSFRVHPPSTLIFMFLILPGSELYCVYLHIASHHQSTNKLFEGPAPLFTSTWPISTPTRSPPHCNLCYGTSSWSKKSRHEWGSNSESQVYYHGGIALGSYCFA
jgi:hypothetical protein